MKTSSSLIAAAAVALGLGGAATAYQVAAATTPTVAPVSQNVDDAARAPSIEAGTHFRWAPCRAPSVRRGHVCVTEVVHTVVLAPPVSTAGGSDSHSGSHGRGSEHAEQGDDGPEHTTRGDDGDGTEPGDQPGADQSGDDGPEPDEPGDD